MKKLIFLLALPLFFSNCYDNFRLGDDTLPAEKDAETVYFSDNVVDKNGKAIVDAEVAIYAAGERYSDKTRFDGEYVIKVPAADLPQSGYISLSITKDDFIPYNSTYKAPLQGGEVYEIEKAQFGLELCPNCLELKERSSELYHLGDDNYGGPENSQFQKTTDGVEVEIELVGSSVNDDIEINFEVKGIQPSAFDDEQHSSVQFYASGELIAEKFIDEDSPEDGSFEVYKMSVDNSKPITSLKFITRNRGIAGSDYDDWEFTNLYVVAEH